MVHHSETHSSEALVTPHGERVTPAFVRIRDVLRITGLSRPTVYRRIAANRFPSPIHLGGRACGWPYAALQAWIADPEGYRGENDQPRRAEPATTLRGPHVETVAGSHTNAQASSMAALPS